MRVQLNGRASAFQAGCVGPIPITRSKFFDMCLQLSWIEHRPSKARVGGSNPSRHTNIWWMQRSRLERKIVDLEVVGSSPTFHPTYLKLNIGVSPRGKARDFDSLIRRFKSCHPSHLKTRITLGCRQVVRHGTLTPTFEGSKPSTPAKNMVHQLSWQST